MKNRELIPFSNGTEAMWWMEKNCDQCTKRSCYSKKMIEDGFFTGTISKKIAENIGFDKINERFVHLKSKCQMYSDKKIIRTRKIKPELTPLLF